MNLIKGLLGFGGSPADKLIDSTKAKGGFYRVINGSRQIKIESGTIEFQKLKDHPQYKFALRITSLDKQNPQQHAIPIHKDMELKVFHINKNKQPKVCYEWILINEKNSPVQYVGIIVDRGYENELSDTFGHTIRQTIDKDSKEDHLSFLEKLPKMPVHENIQSTISSTSSKISNISSTSNVSSASKAERLQDLNDVLIKEATAAQTQLAFTGRLNHVIQEKFSEINPSVIFCIKQKAPFNYSIYVYTSKGYKLEEKQINNQLSYNVNLNESYIKWLDLSGGVSKIVQFVFDKFDVARDVEFTITKCKYQTHYKKNFQDLIKPEDQEYIRGSLEEEHNPFTSPKIVETYEKDDKINFAPTESKNIIKNSKDVVEKYKDKKTMVQGKTAGFTIVSLCNMLDVLTIDENKNLKKVESVELEDKQGNKIIPEKMLIHDSDSKLLIQNENSSVCYYDLNEQKLIDQFSIGNEQKINDIVGEKKLAELDKFNTFIGISDNGIYRIDPRIPKTALAEKHIYKGDKYQFDKIVTTSEGNYAIGSLDGTIRLYNPKINNKTKACNKFPFMDRVLHLDTTKDGKWILATFPNQLILLPTYLEDDINLYEQTVPINDRQRPKRLKINIEDLQNLKIEKYQMIPARFDENLQGEEALIISGFADYVVIWSFNGVLKGQYKYKLYKAEDTVNNVEFKFNDPSSFFANTHTSISMQKTAAKK